MTETVSVFVYGTLRDAKIRQIILGKSVIGAPAILPGYAVRVLAGQLFPTLTPQANGQVAGLLLRDLSAQQVQAISFYLDEALVVACEMVVVVDGSEAPSQVHLPHHPAPSSAADWSFADWQKTTQPAAAEAARQIMRAFAQATPHNTPINHHGLNMRAFSNLRAAQYSAPVHLRRGFSRDEITTSSRTQPYADYFAVEDIFLRHPQFNGGMSETLNRSVFLMADAVTVLPYDPITDQVVLIEQFRSGPYARNDRHPWVLEPVAGRCDADEPVEDVARREVMEEAGLHLRALEKIGSYYSTPGGVTEYLYSYVGIVDLAGVTQATHGLVGEGEDILTHILPYETAMQTLQTGEADNGPLFVSLLWLQLHRARLQNQWRGA